MSKSRSASIKRECSTSATSDSAEVKLEGEDVVRLFDDDTHVVQEPVSMKEEGDGNGEYDLKEEDSVTIVVDPSSSRSVSADVKSSPSPEAGGDEQPSVTPPSESRAKTKKLMQQPQLIGHLPRAEEAATKTFVEIQGNHYQYGTLGRSREAFESMTCDCQYEHGVDDLEDACGPDSDCINRLTQVECLPDDCRCGTFCMNQRFQRKQYAPIHIVQTEKKGFGLRAAENLRKDTFIYEYVGDVVSHPSFLKRMRQYAEEGIRHFYFMMLQKDEFIDATKRGGIGRFANHSCDPNCYVAKWTVGAKVRMGIFAKRAIKKDEELTFNYNVDRYGHEAQPCYCGEAKCVGYIGGKTQTDIAAMDDLYIDALGIGDDVEKLELKGNKKRKSKKLDEDFVPDLKPLTLKDVPKVVQAMRQTQSRKVLLKLLTRVKLTEDQTALRQIMRLRGFSVMTNILEDYATDIEMCSTSIECMMSWPLIQRNKVEDSKVNVPVKKCSESDNVVLAELAIKLLAQWDTLEYAYRIPKRLKEEDEAGSKSPSSMPSYNDTEDRRSPKRSRYEDLDDDVPKLDIKPLGKFGIGVPVVPPSVADESQKLEHTRQQALTPEAIRSKLDKIIAEAAAAAEAERAKAADEAATAAAAATAAEESATKEQKNSSSSKHKKQTPEEKEANKEKRLLKLVGAVVVKYMSKYQNQMDHDTFKKQAKELTHIIAEKEKKSHNYKEGKLDALSDEKVAKIKKFCKEYIAKVLRKLEKSGQRRKPSTTASNHGVSTSTMPSPHADIDSPDHDQQALHDTPDEDMDINRTDDTKWRSSDNPNATSASLHDSYFDANARMDSPPASHSTDDMDVEPSSSMVDVVHPQWDSMKYPQSGDSYKGDASQTLNNTSIWGDATANGDPRVRHRKEESGWDPDCKGGLQRSLLERIQPLSS